MDITWKRKWIFWLLLAVMLLFLPGKTFAAEKESREAEDSYIYHTDFDAKASLKIRHMKDYGVLDYEETVTVEDSCDYPDRLGTGKDGDFGCEYCEQHTFLLCR